MITDALSSTVAATGSSSGSTVKSSANDAMGKDQFLKLLVAQMSHQDPLNPMDGAQYAAQLAQFSSVEQLISLNDKMDTQAATQASIVGALNGGAALAAFGHDVVALGDQVTLKAGQANPVTFGVGGSGGQATLQILDDSGKVVGTRSLGWLNAGVHTLDVGSAADGLADGTYTYAVKATDASGGDVTTELYSTGRVDGIHYGPSGPVLTAGELEIPFGAIVQILAAK